MAAQAGLGERLSSVEAELIYLAPGREKPRTYCYKLPPGVPHSNYQLDKRRHRVYDGRPIAADLSLEREGIALVEFRPELKDFTAAEEVRRRYYPAAEACIKSRTGADLVRIFDHTLRRGEEAGVARDDAFRAPVFKVHVDHTESSGMLCIQNLRRDRAEPTRPARTQIINLWRPLRGPLRDSPLALCDAQTVRPDQLVPVEMVFSDKTVETIRVIYDPNHRWLYFPAMAASEAILFKTYDSATDGRARFVPHSAFTDPAAGGEVLPRESIEIRALVVHYLDS